MDAKQACDKLNGFNFQNRYLVGELRPAPSVSIATASLTSTVLYHQPEKMARSKEDLEARKENLEQLKKQHGIE
jgi:pre-mRNA branch site protein p14